LSPFIDVLEDVLARAGFQAANGSPPDLVFNVVDTESPRPFRRRSQGTFVVALHLREQPPADPLRAGYPVLVQALANMALCYVRDTGVFFTTLERGSYLLPAEGSLHDLATDVVQRLAPLAAARLVIRNEFRQDLEQELWAGDAHTARIADAGRRLGAAGLLPAPFPIEDLVGERDLRHIQRLYGIGGLSYGNLSERYDGNRFWMSASGVDKAALVSPGRDVLLVSHYDESAAAMVVSVPPEITPRRVSVDAIEHWKIYAANPGVGAILHAHAWMDGIQATELDYPCGSVELAESVSALISAQPDPEHAIVGLRNHGITATGTTLTEILDRVEPHLVTQVPMD
jgi:ribulose-5-phosphate 4-epimerase/fuculose-1-phosphate aldolase